MISLECWRSTKNKKGLHYLFYSTAKILKGESDSVADLQYRLEDQL